MSLNKLFGETGWELSRDSYVEAESTKWVFDDRSRLRVSVIGPENYKNFIFLGRAEAEKFLQSFNLRSDDLSELGGQSVYALYRESCLVGITKR